MTIRSVPRPVESTQQCDFNAKKDSIEDLDAFPYLELLQIIADSESQPLPSSVPLMDIYPGGGAPLNDYITEQWEHAAQACVQTNLQNNPYYRFKMCGEYTFIWWGIEKKSMETHFDNMLKDENTPLHFASFKHGDGIQKLVASMKDIQALGQWELHTLEDKKCNDNYRCPIKYWSQAIIKCMRRLMQQPPYTKHHIYSPQRCFNIKSPAKLIYTEMHIADIQLETQVGRDTRC